MNYPELYALFSDKRLQTYAKDGADSDTAFQRYQYNIRLSAALLPALHYVEILLRNRIEQTISALYGDAWLVCPHSAFPFSARDIAGMSAYVKDFTKEQKRMPEQGDIVAHMSFGFWCALFQKQYDPVIWQQKGILKTVFPYLRKTQRNRIFIESRLQQVKALRNRIAHHEQILYMRTPAQDTHALCCDIIGYMSRDALTALREIDRFPDVIADMPNIEARS